MGESLGLSDDAWPNEQEKRNQQCHQKQINHGNCTPTAARPAFHARDGGIDQIREKNGEQKGNQRAVGNVQKAEPQREQQRCG
jgi:hypothetical protein